MGGQGQQGRGGGAEAGACMRGEAARLPLGCRAVCRERPRAPRSALPPAPVLRQHVDKALAGVVRLKDGFLRGGSGMARLMLRAVLSVKHARGIQRLSSSHLAVSRAGALQPLLQAHGVPVIVLGPARGGGVRHGRGLARAGGGQQTSCKWRQRSGQLQPHCRRERCSTRQHSAAGLPGGCRRGSRSSEVWLRSTGDFAASYRDREGLLHVEETWRERWERCTNNPRAVPVAQSMSPSLT